MESGRLETRLGRWPALVLFAGALANHDPWRDVVAADKLKKAAVLCAAFPGSPGPDPAAASVARPPAQGRRYRRRERIGRRVHGIVLPARPA